MFLIKVVFCFLLLLTSADAITYICDNPRGSTEQVTVSLPSDKIPDEQNKPNGKVSFQPAAPGNLYAKCPRPTAGYTIYKHYDNQSYVEYESEDNGVRFFSIDDNVSVAYLEGNVSRITDTFSMRNNKYKKGESFPVNDSDIKIIFKIKKALSKKWHFSGPIFDLKVFLNNDGSFNPSKVQGSNAVYTFNLDAELVPTQSCEINGGQTIVFDFGNIKSNEFKGISPGVRPANVQKMTSQVSVKCSNVDAESVVRLTITANNSAGKIIQSDNDNLGFVIADANGNELTPNDKDSNFPFKVNNGGYNTSIQAWPVSTTGEAPKPGKFTAYGFLNVNFD